ncbi:hypothetical protein RO3G_04847 [Lichtheimia corymbifera JMRC:FSU:9682]|uniref:Uncharacterized protein n=1 Tax=Lichtheimia corymbifera JMRC:FSU:9682 TaxID=1263082 RepID=A0A068RSX8_9FUNG|nr:hypothetical protein RO3G_04847 [Lichtheimia corymbifera JMRC:FSU:9682]
MHTIAYPKAIVPRYTHGDEEAAFVDVELNDKSQQQQGLNIATDDLRKFIGYGGDYSGRPMRLSRLDTCTSGGGGSSCLKQQDVYEDDDDDEEDGYDDAVILNVPEGPTIWEATKEGDVSLVVRALEMAGDNANTLVNTRDPDTQSTLLYLAVTHNKDPVPLLKALLAYGADPTLPNVYSVQAIHALAVHCCHRSILEALQLLLDNEADVNARDGDDWTPLHYVARFVRDEPTLLPALRLLVQRGAHVNATDASQKSPLFALVANGDHAASLDWLVHRAGANIGLQAQFLDPRARSTFLGTAVLQAAKYARVRCLQVLARAHMTHLKESVSRTECEQAVQWILDNKRCHEATRDEMIQAVFSIRRRLEEDPDSAVAIERRRTSVYVPSKRQSLLSSLRRSSTMTGSSSSNINNSSSRGISNLSYSSNYDQQQQQQQQQQQYVQRTPSLLRRMSHILSRQRTTTLDSIA